MWPLHPYAIKRIMRLCDMHLTGVDCTYIHRHWSCGISILHSVHTNNMQYRRTVWQMSMQLSNMQYIVTEIQNSCHSVWPFWIGQLQSPSSLLQIGGRGQRHYMPLCLLQPGYIVLLSYQSTPRLLPVCPVSTRSSAGSSAVDLSMGWGA